MPHRGRDRHPLNLSPPLYCYSQHRAGLRRPVQTCLTPAATVPPTPCTFLPCRTLGGHGRRPSDTVRPLAGGGLKSSAPSTPHLVQRQTLHIQQSSPCRRLEPQTRTRPGSSQRTREDDNHARRHAPQHSTTGTTTVLLWIGRGKGGPVDILHV